MNANDDRLGEFYARAVIGLGRGADNELNAWAHREIVIARIQRDRWRTVAEGLAEIVQCGKDEPPERWPTDEQMAAALAAFEQAKRDFDDPHLPTFTSAKINQESKP